MQGFRSAVAVLFAVAGTCPAAVVSWGSASNITGDANVLNAGTTVAAVNFGNSAVLDTTINGVTFTAFEIANGSTERTVGNVKIASAQTSLRNRAFLTGESPFANLSAESKLLLYTLVTTEGPDSLEVTVSGLTIGQNYSVQAFASYSNDNASASTLLIPGGPTLDVNVSNTVGGLGQYANGTFTANAATQVFTFTGGGDFSGLGALPLLSGLQVRAVVPEPTSAFAVAALAGLALRRRRA